MKNFKKNKYFFAENETSGFDAGGKAVSDAIEIIIKQGYSPIIIKSLKFTSEDNHFFFNKISKVLVMFELIYCLLRLPRDSEIVLNYPTRVNPGRATFWIFSHFKLKKFKIIAIVHDLKELQKTENEKGGDKALINLLKSNQGSKVIVHTNQMKKYIVDLGVSDSQISILGVFDYLLEDESVAQIKSRIKSNEIIIAGNLKEEKMRFLDKIDKLKNITFNLYGNNLSSIVKNYSNVNYFGAFSPDELISQLEGSFGLVWDSDEYEKLVGIKGEYQKINSPHKISLYLAAGYPVILSKEAGMADFIVENNLGFVINGLQEIEDKINAMTDEEYNQIYLNVVKISKKIKEGFFLNEALNSLK